MSNIVKLLERTVHHFESKKKDKSNVSIFILNCENVEQLITHVQKLKHLSNDLITDFFINDEERQIFNKKTDCAPIKVIPPIRKRIDVEILNKIMKHAINDYILITSGKFFINQAQYKSLITETPDCSTVTFLDEVGNILSEIFCFNRWMTKWLIRILVENKQKSIENLFRISPSCCFLKISKFDIITEFQNVDISKIEQNSILFKIVQRKNERSENEVIKLVALFQGIRDYVVNPVKILKFKIQQLLNLMSILLNQKHWFLVFQISAKLLEIVKNIDEKTILPETWTVDRIKKSARKSLINEAHEYATNRIERLRYFSFRDLVNYNLLTQENIWVQNEMSLILKAINEDSNIHYPLFE
ncbi:MAG: hypothetical protein K9W46_05835 [Candidatus Heimdallarchaeum endolithica]|uniref:Uncharacterized protein n=1 Tax=Candidatus Heimdallarchaeum endolithica TaxID=2876572 RepID=A0A9Y1FR12_9ARCH|nr:MAG: hypothetical protein K9W46_05835 [Candidatus Heimdallarchaeum endolithica]